MATQLVHLPDIERLSSRVIRILGGNPGKFTLQGTNTYLVGTGARRLLIDTGEGKPAWAASLRKVLDSEKATVSDAILTHWHGDHVGGVPDLRKMCPSVSVYKHRTTPSEEQEEEREQLPIEDGQEFKTEGATLRAVYCPGHTTDHVALLLPEEDRAMFTGDNVLGQGTAVFEDLATYMDSLRKMLDCKPSRAYPAHGPVCEDGQGKISEYIAHRKMREEQVIAVLKEAADADGRKKPMTAMQVVKIIYKDVPESLHEAARRGIVQILEKLKKEGKVEENKEDDTWSWKGSGDGAPSSRM